MTRLIPASRTANQLTLTGYSSPPAPAAQEHTASAGDLWRILWCRRRVIVATVAILFAGTSSSTRGTGRWW